MLCVLASLWQTTKPNAVIGGQQREKPDFSVHQLPLLILKGFIPAAGQSLPAAADHVWS